MDIKNGTVVNNHKGDGSPPENHQMEKKVCTEYIPFPGEKNKKV